MLRLIAVFFINFALIIVLSLLMKNFNLLNLESAGLFAFILMIINLIILPIVRFLTFPIILLTLGFFNFVINLFAVYFAESIIPGVVLNSTGMNYIFDLFIISITTAFFTNLIKS